MPDITEDNYFKVIDNLDGLRNTIDRWHYRNGHPYNPPAVTEQTRREDEDGTKAIFGLKKLLEGMTTDDVITPGFKMILRKR